MTSYDIKYLTLKLAWFSFDTKWTLFGYESKENMKHVISLSYAAPLEHLTLDTY